MKSMVEPKSEKYKYPYLGEYINSKGMIVVLFYGMGTGIVIFSDDPSRQVGTTYPEWNENHFERFSGKLILEND